MKPIYQTCITIDQVSIYKPKFPLEGGGPAMPGAQRGEGGIKFHITFHPQRREGERREGGQTFGNLLLQRGAAERESVCGAAAAN